MKITFTSKKRMLVSEIPVGTIFSDDTAIFMKVGSSLLTTTPSFVRLSTGLFTTDTYFTEPVEIMEAELLVQPI